jgi:VanZ family protein
VAQAAQPASIDNRQSTIDNAPMFRQWFSLPRRFRRAIWIGYWGLLFVLTHLPVSPQPAPVPQFDKLLHLLAYFGLTLLGARSASRPLSPAALLVWAGVYAGYAALDEYLQQFTQRSMTLADWLADVLGIGLATAISMAQPRNEPESPENDAA